VAQRLYSHLVKPALVQFGPAGLYPKPMIWMEAKDMEGFNGHLAYGFITEPGTLHPTEGMVVHPYDEVLVFAGYQDGNVRRIDAEISIALGAENEIHTFHKPTYVVIPRGTPHGPATVHWVDRPLAHYIIGLSPEYKAEKLAAGASTTGSK
jgi:hypothetical protein